MSVEALFLGGEVIPFDDFVPENFDDLNHGVYSEMVSTIIGGALKQSPCTCSSFKSFLVISDNIPCTY